MSAPPEGHPRRDSSELRESRGVISLLRTQVARLSIVGRILSLARPHWRQIALGTLFLAVGGGLGLAYPQLIRMIIDGVSAGGDPSVVDRAALLMLAMFSIQGIAVGLRAYIFSVVGERVVMDLRVALFEHVLGQEIGFFDGTRTGELLNRLSSDTTVLQNTVSVNISVLLRNLVAATGGVVILALTSIKLTALMLLVVPPVSLAAVRLGASIRKASRRLQDSLAEASEVAEESIGSVRTVKAFNGEEAEKRRYARATEDAFNRSRERAWAVGLFTGIASFAGFSAIAVVLWYGGRLVIDGAMSVGDLTSFVLYTLIVAFSLGALASLWADLLRAAGAAERVFELLDRRPGKVTTGATRLDAVGGNLTFSDVHFRYPTREDVDVLRGVSLTLARDRVVALVGGSGAGKSTIASLIARFYDPSKGTIRLDGVDLTRLDPKWLREQLAIVAQEPVLFSATVEDNIRYGRPGAVDAEVREAARVANVLEFVERFPDGMKTQVGERGVQLSGGQKQRVAIARALLRNPSLLILDEATSALDARSEALVKEALERLMAGRTTLVIAHRLSTVKDADEIVVLDGGRVVEKGDHATLLGEDGAYRELVEAQVQGL